MSLYCNMRMIVLTGHFWMRTLLVYLRLGFLSSSFSVMNSFRRLSGLRSSSYLVGHSSPNQGS
jgi:hypothetical protein